MGMAVMIVSAIASLYGLAWVVFAFVDPPSSISYLVRPPAPLSFLSDRGGRVLMALACFAVAVFASVIVPRFWA